MSLVCSITVEVIEKALLEEGGAGQVERLLAKPHHGQLDLDAAALVQEVGQDDAADLLRETVGDQPIEKGRRVGAADLDLGEGGDVHDADTLAHRPHLFADDVMHDISPEGVVIDRRRAASGEPSGPFMPVDLLEDSALGLQALIERARLDRPAGQAVEVGEGNFVAKAVVFLRFDDLPVLGGIAAEAARIEFAHGDVGRTMDHPAGELAGQARPPADADLRPATAPVVLHPGSGPHQRVAVGRMGDGAMDLALDAEFGKNRHALHGGFEPGHDAVVVGIEQLVLRLPGTCPPARRRSGFPSRRCRSGRTSAPCGYSRRPACRRAPPAARRPDPRTRARCR